MNNFERATQGEGMPWPTTTNYFCASHRGKPCAFTYNRLPGEEKPRLAIPMFMTIEAAASYVRNIAHVRGPDGTTVERHPMRTDIRQASIHARENAYDGLVFCEDVEFGRLTKV